MTRFLAPLQASSQKPLGSLPASGFDRNQCYKSITANTAGQELTSFRHKNITPMFGLTGTMGHWAMDLVDWTWVCLSVPCSAPVIQKDGSRVVLGCPAFLTPKLLRAFSRSKGNAWAGPCSDRVGDRFEFQIRTSELVLRGILQLLRDAGTRAHGRV